MSIGRYFIFYICLVALGANRIFIIVVFVSMDNSHDRLNFDPDNMNKTFRPRLAKARDKHVITHYGPQPS